MKKGFTLIELLAVIVILAIIALIAVPIVLGIINDAKKSSQEESVKMYASAIEDGVANYLLKHPTENKELKLEDIKEYINYSGEKIECETVQIGQKGDVYLAGCTVGSTKIDYEYGTPFTSRKEDYRGYYADVDGDGKVDGVIYADLAEGRSGNFNNPAYNWSQDSGTYSYAKGENLKEYTISKNKYSGKFGEKEIISEKKGSTGNSRFYVMALEDFRAGSFEAGNGACSNGTDCTVGTYYWYKNALSKMPNPVKDTSVEFGTGYANTGTMIRIWNNNGEETGWTTGATQDNQDIWKHIQQEYQEGWYIPSRGEWAAFADYLKEKQSLTNNCSTTSCNDNGNYDDKFGLSNYYWSSSQNTTGTAWGASFNYGYMHDYSVNNNDSVRLGATF